MRWISWVLVPTTLLASGGSHFFAADDRALEGRPPLALTYVANAGVLVAAGNTKILIDALFDRPNPAYRAPSTDTVEKMVNGTAPVDLALVHFWFPFEPNCARFLEDVLRPDHVALTHLPIDREGDIPTKTEAVRQRDKDLILLLPGMATRTFSGGALPARQ